jgi:hypothetical protein
MKYPQQSDKRLPYVRAARRAQQITHRAVLAGELPNLKTQKIRCADCPERANHYDHRDYAKPLEVVPVCQKCNVRRGKAIISRNVPHQGLPRNAHLHIRLYANELRIFKRGSKREQQSLSHWIREACNAWAKRIK